MANSRSLSTKGSNKYTQNRGGKEKGQQKHISPPLCALRERRQNLPAQALGMQAMKHSFQSHDIRDMEISRKMLNMSDANEFKTELNS